jgi:hypothetical protein
MYVMRAGRRIADDDDWDDDTGRDLRLENVCVRPDQIGSGGVNDELGKYLLALTP